MSAAMRAWAIALCALAAVASLTAQTPAQNAATPATKLAVVGNVATPLTLSVEDLARMPVQVVEDVRQVRVGGVAASGSEAVRRYRGVLLRDVLAAAKPVEKERHDLRQGIVVATATDGYRSLDRATRSGSLRSSCRASATDGWGARPTCGVDESASCCERSTVQSSPGIVKRQASGEFSDA